jgi:REP element-mobilizing transposase RayT
MDFRPFDPHGEVTAYRLHLPHWRQPGVTYFLTTRLADSLPQEKLAAWKEERESWLSARGCRTVADLDRLPARERQNFHRHFTARFHAWLDTGYGACWLRNPNATRMVAAALRFFDGERYALGDFVIMPNHLHVLVTPAPGHELSEIVRSWKTYTARQINGLLGRSGAFWQAETYDHIVRSEEQLAHYRRYIVENPVKAKLRDGAYLLGTGAT